MGDVKGKTAVLVDDVLSTGGSLCKAAETAMQHGAKEVYACVTHAVLSGATIETIEKSPLKQVLILDTIEMKPENVHPKIKVISIAKMLSKAIECIHYDRSLGKLYDLDEIYDF